MPKTDDERPLTPRESAMIDAAWEKHKAAGSDHHPTASKEAREAFLAAPNGDYDWASFAAGYRAAHLRTPAPMLMTQEWLDKKVDADPVAEVEACTPARGDVGEMVRPRDHWDADWWKPEPSDPFWMLEAEDGEWLKNRDSLLGTRDATKAIRFPTEETAMAHPARMKPGSKWWNAKATEHLWCDFPKPVTRLSTDTEAGEMVADSGMSGEAVERAEWAWANLPVGPRKWTSLATHEKALVCHTITRLSTDTEAMRLLREKIRLFPEAHDTLTNQELRDAKGNWRSLIDQQTNALRELDALAGKGGV